MSIAARDDVGWAVNALDDRSTPPPDSDATADDEPWSWSVDENALPDFSPAHRRWTSVALAALGILALTGLVVGVLVVSGDSTEPDVGVNRTPAPSVTPTVAATTTPPSPTATPSAVAPAPRPEYTATATASTVVVAPPPPAEPNVPAPNPVVRQRLHELFPRLFPNP